MEEILPDNGRFFWSCYPVFQQTYHNILLGGITWLEADAIKQARFFCCAGKCIFEIHLLSGGVIYPYTLASYSAVFQVFKHLIKAFMLFSGVRVTIDGVLNWMIVFIKTLYIHHPVRKYRQYSAIALLHTFQSTVAHALGFSQSSPVVSWQWVYHSLTVTSNHT
jgi:hypothetical protein